MLCDPPHSPPTVLIPRGGQWGERTQALAHEHGLTPWIVDLIRTDPVPIDGESLADIDFDWIALTSAAALPALQTVMAARGLAAGNDAQHSGGELEPRIAAVGPGTASEIHAAGYQVAHVPQRHDAHGLLEGGVLTGTVLVLRSDLAAPTLVHGLRASGVNVRDVIAYRTSPADVGADDAEQIARGCADAVLVTSGSVARALATLNPPRHTHVVCIGPATQRAAEAVGLVVAAVAKERSIPSMLQACQHLLGADNRPPALPATSTEPAKPGASTTPGETATPDQPQEDP